MFACSVQQAREENEKKEPSYVCLNDRVAVAVCDAIGRAGLLALHRLLSFPDRSLRRAAANLLLSLAQDAPAVQDRLRGEFEIIRAQHVEIFCVPSSFVEMYRAQCYPDPATASSSAAADVNSEGRVNVFRGVGFACGKGECVPLCAHASAVLAISFACAPPPEMKNRFLAVVHFFGGEGEGVRFLVFFVSPNGGMPRSSYASFVLVSPCPAPSPLFLLFAWRCMFICEYVLRW